MLKMEAKQITKLMFNDRGQLTLCQTYRHIFPIDMTLKEFYGPKQAPGEIIRFARDTDKRFSTDSGTDLQIVIMKEHLVPGLSDDF